MQVITALFGEKAPSQLIFNLSELGGLQTEGAGREKRPKEGEVETSPS